MGGRLPTEAEWELASGKLPGQHWCCEEEQLGTYAWYSENSHGSIHEIGEKSPNKYGLFDMHGNVWEWVMDSYDSEYYMDSPKKNPVCTKKTPYRSCRGGSIHGFSEMCRSEFRYYEPAYYSSYDLGFRIAKDIKK
jgi:formylglycine-generating enzyme required for sulfatase activity